jgi:hypothetical protein
MLLSKFGLNYVGDTLNQRALAKQVRTAEKRVLQQFRGTPAESLVNPLLTQLDRALDTTEDEFDPLLEVDFDQLSFTHPSDHRRLREMTLRGISNVYKEVLSRKADWEAACLGPEDVRWLRLMQELAARDDHPRDGTG